MTKLVLGFLKIQCIRIITLIMLQNFRKRKIDIAHYHMSNSIWVCILPQTH